jgi:SPOR domain
MNTHANPWTVIALAGALMLTGCSHENADWKSATTADTAESYQQFLAQHPNSPNAAQAHTRIQQIQEDRDWQTATSADTREAYEQFASQHPDSKWVQEAHIRIENFAQSGAGAGGAGAATAATAATGAPVATTSPGATNMPGKPPHVATMAGAHYVQLGAYHSQAGAESQWKRLSVKYARELGTMTPRYVAGQVKSHPVVRLQVPVSSRAQATALCRKLKAHGQPCVPVGAG